MWPNAYLSKVQQLIVEVETKTKDDVFVKLFVAVQYRVIEEHAADLYYKLYNHVEQIKSFVLDVVRAQVPAMPLDEVFVKKDDVGKAVGVSTRPCECMASRFPMRSSPMSSQMRTSRRR